MTLDRLLLTVEVADLLAVSEEFVRDHAAELGAIRLGAKHSQLRFPAGNVNDFIQARRLERSAPTEAGRRPGRHRAGGVELLPLPDGA